MIFRVTESGRPWPWQRLLLVTLALLTTSVAVALAAAAALERSGSGLDRWLVTSAAVALALGAQVLPALGRRVRWVWPLWLGCLLATLYGHAHFFAASSLRAGAQRADAVAETRQVQAWRNELAAIQARPLATVAAEQALLEGRQAQAEAALQRCERQPGNLCTSASAALAAARARAQGATVERTEAQRAATLREQLTAAAAAQDQARASASQSPVDRYLAQVTGLPLASLGLASSLVQSLLVELLAALLWVVAVSHPPATVAPAPAASSGRPVERPLRRASVAVAAPRPEQPPVAATAALGDATSAGGVAPVPLATPVQARLFDELDISPDTARAPRATHRQRDEGQRAMFLRTSLALTGLK